MHWGIVSSYDLEILCTGDNTQEDNTLKEDNTWEDDTLHIILKNSYLEILCTGDCTCRRQRNHCKGESVRKETLLIKNDIFDDMIYWKGFKVRKHFW